MDIGKKFIIHYTYGCDYNLKVKFLCHCSSFIFKKSLLSILFLFSHELSCLKIIRGNWLMEKLVNGDLTKGRIYVDRHRKTYRYLLQESLKVWYVSGNPFSLSSSIAICHFEMKISAWVILHLESHISALFIYLSTISCIHTSTKSLTVFNVFLFVPNFIYVFSTTRSILCCWLALDHMFCHNDRHSPNFNRIRRVLSLFLSY